MTLCCPRCGSTSITLEAGGYGGMIYRCKECGYRGPLIVEIDDGSGVGSWAADTWESEVSEGGWNPLKPLWVKVLAVVFLLVVIWILF